MKVDTKIANLIAELEYEIGNECYNPNSYNGYTGEEGCEFRYPVWTAKKVSQGEYEEYKHYGLISNLQPQNINTIKYKFGSNHLYIGIGIIKILEYLEERYDIDFNELEKTKKSK